MTENQFRANPTFSIGLINFYHNLFYTFNSYIIKHLLYHSILFYSLYIFFQSNY